MAIKHTIQGNDPTAKEVLGQGSSEVVPGPGAVHEGNMLAVRVAGIVVDWVDLDSMVGDIAGVEPGLKLDKKIQREICTRTEGSVGRTWVVIRRTWLLDGRWGSIRFVAHRF